MKTHQKGLPDPADIGKWKLDKQTSVMYSKVIAEGPHSGNDRSK